MLLVLSVQGCREFGLSRRLESAVLSSVACWSLEGFRALLSSDVSLK